MGIPLYALRCLTARAATDPFMFTGAGVPGDIPGGNRTEWPLTGGSVVLDLHHPWTYVFINLGLGANVSNFNYTLTPQFWNATGNGTLCVPGLKLPSGLTVQDGTQASIQVVTVGDSGSGLYNVSLPPTTVGRPRL